jgi:hypothetical protein
MEFTSSNYKDIQKYYEGTFVKFTEFGDKLFYIDQVKSSHIRGRDENQIEFELYLDDNAPYTVNYLLPHKALFQWKDSVCLLQRIPARQYKRGLCPDNTMITNVATSTRVDVSFDSLAAFVSKPQYVSFTEAINTKGKVKALALTSRMSFIKTGYILIDCTKIAVYDYTTRKISMIKPIFAPEIKKHMQEYNEKYEVVQ